MADRLYTGHSGVCCECTDGLKAEVKRLRGELDDAAKVVTLMAKDIHTKNTTIATLTYAFQDYYDRTAPFVSDTLADQAPPIREKWNKVREVAKKVLTAGRVDGDNKYEEMAKHAKEVLERWDLECLCIPDKTCAVCLLHKALATTEAPQ